MDKKKSLQSLSLTELNQKKKTAQGAAIGLGIVMLIACTILIYLAITTKKPALIAVAVGCAMTFLPVFVGIKQINDEIKSRGK